ncbi:MAG: RagB/SusD family nutrient uptake outer membrane protein [Chitinophagaceae bacterium]|nr:MAG: RagB/SusD family nutrient uptake outer membrane protein [Chitinophagaceae bacterium]
MKKYLFYILSLACFSSCSKVLEEKPQSIAAELFYNTPAEIEAGLNAIYTPVRGTDVYGAFYEVQLEIYTEYMYGRGSHGPLNDYVGLDNTNITRIASMWSSFYRAIRNANIVIGRAPLATGVTEPQLSRYLGEARYLRALWYYQMVRNWAGVPLRTETNMDSINVPRASVTQVYDLILSDLLFAETNLAETPRLVGAPSRWAAKTALTDVYLSLGMYPEARTKSLEVINSNRFRLVEVAIAADFEKLFGTAANNTLEEIFYLKYSATLTGQSFFYPLYAHYPNSGFYPPGGFYTLYSDSQQNPFMRDWDRNDLRYQFNYYPRTFGLGNTTILSKKFSDLTAVVGAGNDFPIYRYADLLMMYAEADARVNGGVTADGLEKLNMVHRRAYGQPSTVASAVDLVLTDYPTLDAFITRLVKERAYENVDEGKHWLDLKRLGIAKQTILAVKGKTVQDKHLLWPIPTTEYNYNKAINPATDQNPGY